MAKHEHADVQRATGRSRAVLRHWRKKGVLPPVHSHNGGYSPRDVLAIELAQMLRDRGFALSECKGIVAWLREIPGALLARMLAAGRRYVIVVGGQVTNPPLTLWRRGEVFDNPHLDLAAFFAVDRPFAILDVGAALVKVAEKLEPAAERPRSITIPHPKQTEGVPPGSSSSMATPAEPVHA